MRKLLLLCALVFCSAYSLTAQQLKHNKLSASTRQYLNYLDKGGDAINKEFVYKIIDGKAYLSGLVKVNADANAALIAKNTGAKIGTQAGNIWTVSVPTDRLKEFVGQSAISYIDLDVPIFPLMDSARKQTKADSAQWGYNLPHPMTGKNVICGIIDAGFDLNHPTMYDSVHGAYRVKRVWLQKSSGTPPSGFAYGREITDEATMHTVATDTVITSHGTHVTGIAAGSGYASSDTNNRRFRGMAYESDIVIVAIMPASTQWINTGVSDIVDGMNYIYTYAASVGKPAIVNLSWGSTLGPHDGSSLFSQACDALTGSGKIFACSAGNNGEDLVHLQKIFSATDTVVSTFVTFSPYLDSFHQNTYVDVWGDTGKTFCLNLKLYNAGTAIDSTSSVCLVADSTYEFYLIGSNLDTCFVTIVTSPVEYNARPHAYVYIHSEVHDDICLTTTANSGVVNMWEGYVMPPTGYYGSFSNLGYSWATTGDSKMTISDISSTRSAIAVGAFVGKRAFKNILGTNLSYSSAIAGKIAYFSSLGPTADNRVKPDITAPGFGIASAVSSHSPEYLPGGDSYSSVVSSATVDGNTYYYGMMAGTSMSCPAASGIIAMFLQMQPTLTPDSVKSLINSNAIQDIHTGVLPPAGNNTWGHGKINAYKTLRSLNEAMAVTDINSEKWETLVYPNPSTGLFSVLCTLSNPEVLDVNVVDVTGREVYKKSVKAVAGSNEYQVALANIVSGLYYLSVSDGKGHIATRKIEVR